MAKKPVKAAAVKKAPVKKSAPAKKAAAVKPKAPAAHQIEKVNEDILKKLQDLDVEQALQADIAWCLGSYRNDNNPSGLYIMAERALQVFEFELTKDSASVPAKLIKDIEKALKNK
jgi:hypothetical protein